MHLTDFLGKEYGPGDLVIYGAMSGRSVNVCLARVIDIYRVWFNCYDEGDRYGWERISYPLNESLLAGRRIATRVKVQPIRAARWTQHRSGRAVTLEITENIVKWEGELPGEVPDEVS